ncbi:MAG: hypothetical protein AAF989_07685 [Planctomycetota bacterium]
MLGEFKVGRCTRRCFTLNRPLREGEVYYSVVIENDEQIERRDYSAESWNGAPDGILGWWKNRMPTLEQRKMVLAPNEVLVDLVRQMAKTEGQEKPCYLLALMLMRKKVLRESRTQASTDQTVHAEVTDDGSAISFPIATIDRSEVETLTEELNSLLYCEADADD